MDLDEETSVVQTIQSMLLDPHVRSINVKINVSKPVDYVELKFEEKFVPEKEKHLANFWKSFYESIQQAGGNCEKFNLNMTLVEVANELAQNHIRFVYQKPN